MIGFGGSDFYYVNAGADRVIEAPGGGRDWVMLGRLALGAGQAVEILSTDNQLGTAAINLTGNEFANEISGNAAANILNGGGGPDRLFGYKGGDQLTGGYGADLWMGLSATTLLRRTASRPAIFFSSRCLQRCRSYRRFRSMGSTGSPSGTPFSTVRTLPVRCSRACSSRARRPTIPATASSTTLRPAGSPMTATATPPVERRISRLLPRTSPDEQRFLHLRISRTPSEFGGRFTLARKSRGSGIGRHRDQGAPHGGQAVLAAWPPIEAEGE